ncbi:hypothetical protein [Cochlodiniinecator piscidefendens]|uniref:hypothetical protein n=1 Tax=Cochlodiniinecator piscidefendens TaxID=2715756 RepID=UPI00140DC977|nr:hypothetical protein [Cochlodiniinecator piscidefendens]
MEYEEVVAMIAMMDAALEIGRDHRDEIPGEILQNLDYDRNSLNAIRKTMLGNGEDRPWHVSDLELQAE